MSRANVRLVVEADMAQAFSAYARLHQEEAKATRGFREMANAARGADAASARATRSLVTQVQRQTRGGRELALSSAGRAAAMGVAGGAFADAAQSRSFERFVTAQRMRADRAMKTDRFREFARFNNLDVSTPEAVREARTRRAQELRERRVAARPGRLGAAVNAIGGAGVLTAGMSSIAGLAGVGSAAAFAAAALQKMSATAEAAGERIRGMDQTRRQISQVSDGSQEEKDRLQGEVENIRTKFGIGPEVAGQFIFEMKSAGKSDRESFELFASTQAVGMDPLAAVAGVQKMQANFGDERSGSDRSVLNQIFAAAADSPVNAGMISSSASVAAQSYAGLGGRSDELLAMIGTFSTATKSPEMAAELVNSLSMQVLRKRDLGQINLADGYEGLAGVDLLMALPKLAAEGRLTGAGGEAMGLNPWLGEMNAMKAMGVIQTDPEAIRRQIAKVRAAGQAGSDDDRLGRMLALKDPQSEANLKANIAEQELQILEEGDAGILRRQSDEYLARNAAGMRREGTWGLGVATQDTIDRASRFMLGDETFLRTKLAVPAGRRMDDEFRGRFEENLSAATSKLGVAADNLERSTRRPLMSQTLP